MTPFDLGDVNKAVNQLPYKPDPPGFDNWCEITESGGDCDSYAMAKLRRLLKRGWPIDRLRLACCWTELGDYHAVLVVLVDVDNELVLDNRYPFPMSLAQLDELSYRPDVIQSAGGSLQWVKWLWALRPIPADRP